VCIVTATRKIILPFKAQIKGLDYFSQETQASIKEKLGAASADGDGYMTQEQAAQLAANVTIFQDAVISKTVTDPPTLPEEGWRYIIPTGATGDWSGKTNQIAEYSADLLDWVYTVPVAGWVVQVLNPTLTTYTYYGASWVLSTAESTITASYVQSRGQNLVTNGGGLLGTNYNFSGFTFDQTETFGGMGSFLQTLKKVIATNELIPVDVDKRYRMILHAKSGDTGGGNFNATNRQYSGVDPRDVDNLSVGTRHSCKYEGSVDTTLAAQLNPGDTTVTLTDATGWYEGSAYSRRHFCWYGYTNAKGYTYPDYTYTRNVSQTFSSNYTLGTWDENAIVGNVITLRVPWAGPTIPAGSAVRNNPDGGTYQYCTMNYLVVPNEWTKYEGYMTPAAGDGIARQEEYRAGTAYVKLLFLTNYDGVTQNYRVSMIWFSEMSVHNLEYVPSPLEGSTSIVSLGRVTSGSVDPRTNTVASSATPSINTDTTDAFTITALAANITSMTTNLSGTPVNAQRLLIRFKDNGTARTILWGTSYGHMTDNLPGTTIANKELYVLLQYNSVASKWYCMAAGSQA